MRATDTADVAITNAKVVTLDKDDATFEAVAVRGERIAAVGTNAEIAAWISEDTRHIDANHRAVMPGLVDGHAHLDREGLKEALPPLTGCADVASVLARIEALAAQTKRGEWVVTMPVGEPPFYEDVVRDPIAKRFPTRDQLDQVAPDHPVYIRAIWGHWRNSLPLVSVANSKALEIAGIDQRTIPPAPSIEIERDASGALTGRFIEQTFKPLVEKTLMACIPQFSLTDRTTGLARSMQIYNSFGTTSVFEGHGVAGEVLAAYQAMRARGPLPVRAQLMFSPAWPNTDAAAVKDLLVDWGRWLSGRGLGDDYLRMAGLYTESDFSNENRLRAQCGPYTGWAGFNYDSALPEALMEDMMVEAARAGIRVGSFSPNLLSSYERVNKRVPITEQRWLIEHIGIINADEIERIRDLGLVLQAYTNKYIWQDGESLRAQLGERGASSVVPMRSLIDAGVHVSLATDNVPPTLFAPISHVVTRRTETGSTPLAPEQCITRREALACASREGAWLSFEENDKGTLEVGKFADLVVFKDDPLTVDEHQLPEACADITITGGNIVFERND
ncbi:MAG: amidohydrolase [Gammaproteobacteria bacterium]|nr:amidohydrolase [Gammaproteobacteria bacterium]